VVLTLVRSQANVGACSCLGLSVGVGHLFGIVLALTFTVKITRMRLVLRVLMGYFPCLSILLTALANC